MERRVSNSHMGYQEWVRRNLVELVGFFNQALIGDDQKAHKRHIKTYVKRQRLN